MKAQSAKAKGQKLCKEFRKMLFEAFDELEPDDIKVTPSGVNDEDLQLSPKAREKIPASFEMKHRQSMAIYKFWEQAKKHAKERGVDPILVVKQNRDEPLVVIRAPHFIGLLTDAQN